MIMAALLQVVWDVSWLIVKSRGKIAPTVPL